MTIPEATINEALNKGWILHYEEDLIKRLRYLNYRGFPLSIVLFSREFCIGECYSMSMNLSRAMDSFKLIHGDVNFITGECDYPKHSWIEKDGYVYDTTDGLKWKKDLYYSLFEPNVIESYDEISIKDYYMYQQVLSHANEQIELVKLKLIIQYMEMLEQENPYVNYRLLQREIDLWREQNGITDRFSDETMEEYKRILVNMKNE